MIGSFIFKYLLTVSPALLGFFAVFGLIVGIRNFFDDVNNP